MTVVETVAPWYDGQPTVSVIVPFLNAGPFLTETIESVLAQTYAAWELLLVDDGSTDAGAEVARRYARRFPDRIRYLEHAGHGNRGKSTSRNLGIEHARGRLIAFLDADDVFLRDKLARQVALLEGQPAAVMVYGNTEYWFTGNPAGAGRKRDRIGKLGVAPDRLYDPPDLLTAYLREPGIVPCICGLLVRRAIAVEVGAFDESIQDLYEDQVFIAKLILRGPVYVEPGVGERYRQHAGSTSALAIAEKRYHPRWANDARKGYLQWLDDYVARQPAGANRRLQRALRAAQRPYRLRRLLKLD